MSFTLPSALDSRVHSVVFGVLFDSEGLGITLMMRFNDVLIVGKFEWSCQSGGYCYVWKFGCFPTTPIFTYKGCPLEEISKKNQDIWMNMEKITVRFLLIW